MLTRLLRTNRNLTIIEKRNNNTHENKRHKKHKYKMYFKAYKTKLNGSDA